MEDLRFPLGEFEVPADIRHHFVDNLCGSEQDIHGSIRSKIHLESESAEGDFAISYLRDEFLVVLDL